MCASTLGFLLCDSYCRVATAYIYRIKPICKKFCSFKFGSFVLVASTYAAQLSFELKDSMSSLCIVLPSKEQDTGKKGLNLMIN